MKARDDTPSTTTEYPVYLFTNEQTGWSGMGITIPPIRGYLPRDPELLLWTCSHASGMSGPPDMRVTGTALRQFYVHTITTDGHAHQRMASDLHAWGFSL